MPTSKRKLTDTELLDWLERRLGNIHRMSNGALCICDSPGAVRVERIRDVLTRAMAESKAKEEGK